MYQTVTARLSAIALTVMGENVVSKKGEHLLCTLPFPEPKDLIKKLEEQHPHLKVTYKTVQVKNNDIHSSIELPDELYTSATILVTLGALPPPHLAKNLKFIHFYSAGINHIQKDPIYTQTDIPLTTSSGVHGPAISEWVVLQILSNGHAQKKLLEWQREHKWGTHSDLRHVRDSVGMRLGVLGYGSIGRQTARVCKAMGMDVIAFTASPRKTPDSKKDHGYIPKGTGDPDGSIPSAWYSGLDKPSLHNFLSQDIDILLISVPLTEQTKHFLAAPEFKILGEKRNAFIVNISRGSIIKQDDLVAAVKKDFKDGGLRGAALDVTDPEPLSKDDEIWDIENVAITPHVSGLSTAYTTRAFEILNLNIAAVEEGKPLINVVDRKKGY